MKPRQKRRHEPSLFCIEICKSLINRRYYREMHTIQKSKGWLADRVGFEPTVRFPAR